MSEGGRPHRAGFVAICGLPNAGKSTLLNRMLKARLSIVSARPQTTRHKILGFLNGEDHQVVFVDTPGWLEAAKDRLQDALRRAAAGAARDEADVLLWVSEGAPGGDEAGAVRALARPGKKLVLALNKADQPGAKDRLTAAEAALKDAAPWDTVIRISALQGAGVDELVRRLISMLPEGPAFYPKDQITDRWERFFAAEIVREQVFEQFGEEVPHATAVVLERYEEAPGRPDLIQATLVVERDGQKAILIGKGGRALGRLREAAQKAIAAFIGRPVMLELWVKVRKDWRKDPQAVREFGY